MQNSNAIIHVHIPQNVVHIPPTTSRNSRHTMKRKRQTKSITNRRTAAASALWLRLLSPVTAMQQSSRRAVFMRSSSLLLLTLHLTSPGIWKADNIMLIRTAIITGNHNSTQHCNSIAISLCCPLTRGQRWTNYRHPVFEKTCATSQKNVKSHVFWIFEKNVKKT